jgi:predicted alternative tryptophan synthase beta-subunit
LHHSSYHGAVPNFAFLGESGVAEIELLQQFEMQGGRYFVERYGQQARSSPSSAQTIALARSIASAASSNSDRIWVAYVPSIVFDSRQRSPES